MEEGEIQQLNFPTQFDKQSHRVDVERLGVSDGVNNSLVLEVYNADDEIPHCCIKRRDGKRGGNGELEDIFTSAGRQGRN